MLDLTKYRKIFLEDYIIDINIGVYDYEKISPQKIIINVELYILLENTISKNDDINDIFDYNFIKKSIDELVTEKHIELQETFCDKILDKMISHNLVHAARVSIKKPDIYKQANAVGVERFFIKN